MVAPKRPVQSPARTAARRLTRSLTAPPASANRPPAPTWIASRVDVSSGGCASTESTYAGSSARAGAAATPPTNSAASSAANGRFIRGEYRRVGVERFAPSPRRRPSLRQRAQQVKTRRLDQVVGAGVDAA